MISMPTLTHRTGTTSAAARVRTAAGVLPVYGAVATVHVGCREGAWQGATRGISALTGTDLTFGDMNPKRAARHLGTRTT